MTIPDRAGFGILFSTPRTYPGAAARFTDPPWGVQELLHHHGHEKQLTGDERERLLSEGVAGQGTVLHCEPSAADRGISQVRVSVRLKDSRTAEFSEELANLYQPAPGSAEAQWLVQARGAQQLRHPDRIPKIQLPLSAGERVLVRFEATDLSKIVIDVPALRKRALHDYLQREQRQKEQPPARAPKPGRPGQCQPH